MPMASVVPIAGRACDQEGCIAADSADNQLDADGGQFIASMEINASIFFCPGRRRCGNSKSEGLHRSPSKHQQAGLTFARRTAITTGSNSMKTNHMIRLGLSILGIMVAITAESRGGDIVNEASYSIEFMYGSHDPVHGINWSDPVRIDSGYMVTVPNEINGAPTLGIWRNAASPGDSGWGYITGLNNPGTGYIGEYLTIEFRN
jgi:hypothetical protein